MSTNSRRRAEYRRSDHFIRDMVPGGVTWTAAKAANRPVRTWLAARFFPGRVRVADVYRMQQAL